MPVTLSGVFSGGLKRAGEPPVPEESGRHSSLKEVGSFSEQLHLKGDDMKSFFAHVALAFVGLVLSTGAGCPGPGDQGTGDPPTTLTISLYNDSCGTYISPRFAVCPKGMAEQPHYFVEPPVVLAPGQSVTYKTDQVAGATDGDCAAFSTAFMVGIPGWGYGPTSNPDIMTYVGMPDDSPYVGLIGVQFHCGDTINLRWSNCGNSGVGAGTWTSEVVPASGNPAPSSPFGPPS